MLSGYCDQMLTGACALSLESPGWSSPSVRLSLRVCQTPDLVPVFSLDTAASTEGRDSQVMSGA